jgi:hypothetical protein
MSYNGPKCEKCGKYIYPPGFEKMRLNVRLSDVIEEYEKTKSSLNRNVSISDKVEFVERMIIKYFT